MKDQLDEYNKKQLVWGRPILPNEKEKEWAEPDHKAKKPSTIDEEIEIERAAFKKLRE